ncbi:MAG: histidine phosphatase family protein [Zoogloeaceae bacterium]|jgi:phosphohistidine phosphatase|nr:histidine phosphatase family protein [Zoogloeaceae bacterium]
MELLLWRHAEALDGAPDHTRELSTRGQKQARKIALWLEARAPKNLRLIVSPTIRTRQTAGRFRLEMEICEALATNAPPAEILSMLDWPNAKTPFLVVGHQPMLGEIAAHLLQDAPHPPDFRKGALWWLHGEAGQKTELRQVVEAENLAGIIAYVRPEDEKRLTRALRLEEAGKYRRAFKRFRKLAKRNTAAMTNLAHLYYQGHGVEYSFEKTVKWNTKAAEQGDISGMFNLGVTYRRAGDVRTAKKWFEQALQAGDGSAALELAKMYLISERETERVKDYLRRALEVGWLSEADEEEIQALLDELNEKSA